MGDCQADGRHDVCVQTGANGGLTLLLHRLGVELGVFVGTLVGECVVGLVEELAHCKWAVHSDESYRRMGHAEEERERSALGSQRLLTQRRYSLNARLSRSGARDESARDKATKVSVARRAPRLAWP